MWHIKLKAKNTRQSEHFQNRNEKPFADLLDKPLSRSGDKYYFISAKHKLEKQKNTTLSEDFQKSSRTIVERGKIKTHARARTHARTSIKSGGIKIGCISYTRKIYKFDVLKIGEQF